MGAIAINLATPAPTYREVRIQLQKPVKINGKQFTTVEFNSNPYYATNHLCYDLITSDGEYQSPTEDKINLATICDIAEQLPAVNRNYLLDTSANIVEYLNIIFYRNKNKNLEAAVENDEKMKSFIEKYNFDSFIDRHLDPKTHLPIRAAISLKDGSIATREEVAAKAGVSVEAMITELVDIILPHLSVQEVADYAEFIRGLPKMNKLRAKYAREEKAAVRVLLPSRRETAIAGEIFAATGLEVSFPDGIMDNGLNTANIISDGSAFSVVIKDGKPYIPYTLLATDDNISHTEKDFRKCTPSTAARLNWNDTATGDEVTFDKDFNEKTRRPLENNTARRFARMADERISEFNRRAAKENIDAIKSRISEGYTKLLNVTRNNYASVKTFISSKLAEASARRMESTKERRFMKRSVKDINERFFLSAGVDRRDVKNLLLKATTCLAHVYKDGDKETVTIIDHASKEEIGTFTYDRNGKIYACDGCFSECASKEQCADIVEGIVLHPSNVESLRNAKIESLIERTREDNPTLLNGWSRLECYQDANGIDHFLVYKPTDKNIPSGAYVTDNIDELRQRLGNDVKIFYGEDEINTFKEGLRDRRKTGRAENIDAPIAVDVMESSIYMIRPYKKDPWAKEQQLAIRPIEAFIGTLETMEIFDNLANQVSAMLDRNNIAEGVNASICTKEGTDIPRERIDEEIDKSMAFHKERGFSTHLGKNSLFIKDGDRSLILYRTPDGELTFMQADSRRFSVTPDNGIDGEGCKTMKQVLKEIRDFSQPKMKELQAEVQHVLIKNDGATGRREEIITEEHKEASGIKLNIG